MTLARQIIVVMSLLFALLLAGTLAISVNNMRAYVGEQLSSHAQDTATSLGLSLVPAMESGDVVLMETMVNAIFDPGYYREVSVLDAEGKPLVERVLPVQIEGVPQWFVRWIRLETPTAESEISTGWRVGGRVVVSSHPGYAYRELWRVAVHTFWWFAAAAVAAVLVLLAVLRLVMRPLRAVERQAMAICEREFPTVERLPRTRELRRVVEAMNGMVVRVRQMLSDQTELTERMREEAGIDPVTGLGNRRHFDARLNYVVEHRDEYLSGALFLAQLAGFKEYNERNGYEAGDELLRETARTLRTVFADEERTVLARLGGGNFGVLMWDVPPAEAFRLGEGVAQALEQFCARGAVDHANAGNVGLAYYEGARTASELLSEADMALRAAAGKGPNTLHAYDADAMDRADVRTAGQWLKIIRSVIDSREILLYFQPVVSIEHERIEHYEVLSRIVGPSGKPIPAAVFVPMAERHGITREFDQLVVELVLEHLESEPEFEGRLAVNLSPASVFDPGFIAWLEDYLADRPAARRIVFEVSEYGVARQPERIVEVAPRLRAAAGGLGLDHFGAGFAPFGYLRDLKLEYIKVDGSYIRGIGQRRDHQFFVEALADIAHGLEARVIAEAVENQEEWNVLAGLHVDAAQGYFIGMPRAWGAEPGMPSPG
jgi:diguanylate cyclase (GGDEF)-like protein